MADEDEVLAVFQVPPPPTPVGYIHLNVIWNGQSDDLPDPILADTSDDAILRIAEEAIRNGGIPGINADPNVDFRAHSYTVDPATRNVATGRVTRGIRPKTGYGSR